MRDSLLAPRVLGPALRASVAVAAPLVAGSLLGLPFLAQWATIGALYASLVDAGGPYRERAIAVGLATGLAAAALAAGSIAGASAATAIAAATLLAGLGGLGRAFGDPGSSIGLVFTFAGLVGIGHPAESAADALDRGLVFVSGGAFSLLLSLLPGSVRPFGPMFRAVAETYEAAARYARVAGAPRERGAEMALREAAADVRRAIEAARERLGTARSTEDGAHSATERLYVLLRAGSRLSAAIARLATAIEGAAMHREYAAVRPAAERASRELADSTLALARLVDEGGRGSLVEFELLDLSLATAARFVDAARDAAPFPGARYQAILDARGVVRALEAAADHLRSAADVASRLALAAPGRPAREARRFGAGEVARRVAGRLASQATLGSVLFRHALRVALAVGGTLALVFAAGIPRGYWAAVSVMVVLQPDFGGTRRRAVERSLGTLAGSVAAPLLAFALPGPIVHLVVISALTLAFFIARGRQFVVSTAAVTTLFLLVIDLSTPIAPIVAAERFGNTLLGAVIALVAGYRLWPSWERSRFSTHLAAAIRANRELFAAVVRRDSEASSSARRKAEVEALNAEASYQRLLGDPEAWRGDPLPRFALVTANDRLRRSITSLEHHLGPAPEGGALPRWDDLGTLVVEALDEIAAAHEAGRAPAPLPEIEETFAALRSHVRGLVEARVAEIREGKGDTATKRAVLETAFVEREVDRMIREIVDLHAVSTVLAGGVRTSSEEP